MDILLNIYLRDLKFCIDNDNILLEGGVSQVFDLGLRFILCQKTGNFWSFFKTFFSRVHKIKIGPKSKF